MRTFRIFHPRAYVPRHGCPPYRPPPAGSPDRGSAAAAPARPGNVPAACILPPPPARRDGPPAAPGSRRFSGPSRESPAHCILPPRTGWDSRTPQSAPRPGQRSAGSARTAGCSAAGVSSARCSFPRIPPLRRPRRPRRSSGRNGRSGCGSSRSMTAAYSRL